VCLNTNEPRHKRDAGIRAPAPAPQSPNVCMQGEARAWRRRRQAGAAAARDSREVQQWTWRANGQSKSGECLEPPCCSHDFGVPVIGHTACGASVLRNWTRLLAEVRCHDCPKSEQQPAERGAHAPVRYLGGGVSGHRWARYILALCCDHKGRRTSITDHRRLLWQPVATHLFRS
jgi:hypothetical protein